MAADNHGIGEALRDGFRKKLEARRMRSDLKAALAAGADEKQMVGAETDGLEEALAALADTYPSKSPEELLEMAEAEYGGGAEDVDFEMEGQDGDPASFAGTEKAGAADRDGPDMADEKARWVPYQGPRGGEGWRDTESGRVVYGDEPPGETPDADDLSDDQIQTIADEAGVSPDEVRSRLEEALGGGEAGGGIDPGSWSQPKQEYLREAVGNAEARVAELGESPVEAISNAAGIWDDHLPASREEVEQYIEGHTDFAAGEEPEGPGVEGEGPMADLARAMGDDIRNVWGAATLQPDEDMPDDPVEAATSIAAHDPTFVETYLRDDIEAWGQDAYRLADQEAAEQGKVDEFHNALMEELSEEGIPEGMMEGFDALGVSAGLAPEAVERARERTLGADERGHGGDEKAKAAEAIGKLFRAKARRYIDDPSEAPEGADVEEGPEGGLYYETGTGEAPAEGAEEEPGEGGPSAAEQAASDMDEHSVLAAMEIAGISQGSGGDEEAVQEAVDQYREISGDDATDAGTVEAVMEALVMPEEEVEGTREEELERIMRENVESGGVGVGGGGDLDPAIAETHRESLPVSDLADEAGMSEEEALRALEEEAVQRMERGDREVIDEEGARSLLGGGGASDAQSRPSDRVREGEPDTVPEDSPWGIGESVELAGTHDERFEGEEAEVVDVPPSGNPVVRADLGDGPETFQVTQDEVAGDWQDEMAEAAEDAGYFSTTDPDAGQAMFDAIDSMAGPGEGTKDQAKDALIAIGDRGEPLTEANVREALDGLHMSPADKDEVVDAARQVATGGGGDAGGGEGGDDEPRSLDHDDIQEVNRMMNEGADPELTVREMGLDDNPEVVEDLVAEMSSWAPGSLGDRQNYYERMIDYIEDESPKADDPTSKAASFIESQRRRLDRDGLSEGLGAAFKSRVEDDEE